MPGFRKGKVPRRLLEARLGTEALREEALKEALPEYFAEALKNESIDAVSPPEIDNLSADEGADVSFDAVVEVRPTVDLGDWKSLSAFFTPTSPPKCAPRARSSWNVLSVRSCLNSRSVSISAKCSY